MIAEQFSWSSIRIIGSSLPARLTILFPAVSNFLIFNKHISDLYPGDISVFRSVPFLSQKFEFFLLCMFFGLLLFSMGQIVYTLFCPAVIKKYAEVDGLLLSISGVMSKSVLLTWARYAENSANIEYEEKTSDGLSSAISVLEGKPFTLPEMHDQMINISRIYYRSRDFECPLARYVSGTFFGVGVATMFVPSFVTIYSAAKIVF